MREDATLPSQGETPALEEATLSELMGPMLDELLGPLKDVDPVVLLTSLC